MLDCLRFTNDVRSLLSRNVARVMPPFGVLGPLQPQPMLAPGASLVPVAQQRQQQQQADGSSLVTQVQRT